MKSERTARYISSFTLALSIYILQASLPATAFDLDPVQTHVIRAEKSKLAENISPEFKFVSKGVLTVGLSPDASPPLSTYATDAKTVVGFDVDLAQLIADGLGRELVLVPVAWDDWPLGLQSGKFDAVLSNVTVTEERKEKFDFSTYRRDDLGFYVKADSHITSIREPKDIAGLTVITDAGTNQEEILVKWDKENVGKGLKAATIQYYDDKPVADLALQSGRADVIFSVNAILAYEALVGGKTKLVGTLSGGWPLTAEVAITSRKGSGIADTFTALLNELIANGKYGEVLAKWNLSSEAIDKSVTNPAGLPKA